MDANSAPSDQPAQTPRTGAGAVHGHQITRTPTARRSTMTQPTVLPLPEGIHSITPHIVVRDAARAAEWYKQALGAIERDRLPMPNGKLMQVDLRFGDSAVMLADEFPEAGI